MSYKEEICLLHDHESLTLGKQVVARPRCEIDAAIGSLRDLKMFVNALDIDNDDDDDDDSAKLVSCLLSSRTRQAIKLIELKVKSASSPSVSTSYGRVAHFHAHLACSPMRIEFK